MHHFPIYLHNTEPHPVLSCALLLPMVISVAASSTQPSHLLTFSWTEGGFVRRSQPYNCSYPTAPYRPAGDVSGGGTVPSPTSFPMALRSSQSGGIRPENHSFHDGVSSPRYSPRTLRDWGLRQLKDGRDVMQVFCCLSRHDIRVFAILLVERNQGNHQNNGRKARKHN